MEKCGIKKDLTKIVISATRVCSTHFEQDFFVPSLYLDNGKKKINYLLFYFVLTF